MSSPGHNVVAGSAVQALRGRCGSRATIDPSRGRPQRAHSTNTAQTPTRNPRNAQTQNMHTPTKTPNKASNGNGASNQALGVTALSGHALLSLQGTSASPTHMGGTHHAPHKSGGEEATPTPTSAAQGVLASVGQGARAGVNVSAGISSAGNSNNSSNTTNTANNVRRTLSCPAPPRDQTGQGARGVVGALPSALGVGTGKEETGLARHESEGDAQPRNVERDRMKAQKRLREHFQRQRDLNDAQAQSRREAERAREEQLQQKLRKRDEIYALNALLMCLEGKKWHMFEQGTSAQTTGSV